VGGVDSQESVDDALLDDPGGASSTDSWDDTDRDDPNECGCTDERQDRAANEPPYAIKSANVFLHYLSLRVRTQPILGSKR